jgi:hypothetical protein
MNRGSLVNLAIWFGFPFRLTILIILLIIVAIGFPFYEILTLIFFPWEFTPLKDIRWIKTASCTILFPGPRSKS